MPLVSASLVGARKGLLAKDSFDRPDSAVLGAADSGQAWTATPDFTIAGSRLATGDANTVLATLEVRAPDVEVEATVYLRGSGANHRWPGLVARQSDDNNFILALLAEDILRIYKRDAGVYTELANVAVTAPSGAGYKLRLVCRGPILQVYLEGVLKLTQTQSFNQGATRVGFHNDAAGVVAVGRFADDFVVRRAS